MPERFFEENDVVEFGAMPEGLVSIKPKPRYAIESLLYIISNMGLKCAYSEQSNMITIKTNNIKIVRDLLNVLRQNQKLISKVILSNRDRKPLRELLKEAL